MERLDAEIDRALNGSRDGSQHGNDIFWLMGWADWSIEKQLIEEQADKANGQSA